MADRFGTYRELRCVVCDARVLEEDDSFDLTDALRVYLCYQHRKHPHFAQTPTGRWIYHQDYGEVHALGWPKEPGD